MRVVTDGADDSRSRRTAVIGDVAGHLDELRRELTRLGADQHSGELPPDLTIVQVGDLIHRGPASDGVVALVDHYLTEQPEQWVQLVGNHEAQYLRQPLFDWPERVAPESIKTLRRWWATGQLRVAASVVTDHEGFLVTHAGLTAGFWRQVLGAPTDVEEAARALNGLIGTAEDVLFRPGHMLGGRRKDPAAGPLWAATTTELAPGWMRTPLPFSQVHGHASAFDWRHRKFRGPQQLARLATVDEVTKHVTLTLEGGRIIGIDPGHGHRAQRPWQAWEAQTVVGPR